MRDSPESAPLPEHFQDLAPVSAPRSAFDPGSQAQMERLVEDLGRLYRERNEALCEVTRAHHEALYRLATAAELRDDDTGTHIVRMGFIAEALAAWMGRPAEEAQRLRLAAPMHDLGKIGVPDHVLKKPGPLTPEERALMNEHPRMGAQVLGRSNIELFRLAAEVALSHHERWNGTGYPSGLAASQIPWSGRIVAAVDYLDALTMDRCYRVAFDDQTALRMLTEERGRAFDPEVVDTMLANADALFALRDRINARDPTYGDLTTLCWNEIGQADEPGTVAPQG